jgi:hypothetical protein
MRRRGKRKRKQSADDETPFQARDGTLLSPVARELLAAATVGFVGGVATLSLRADVALAKSSRPAAKTRFGWGEPHV